MATKKKATKKEPSSQLQIIKTSKTVISFKEPGCTLKSSLDISPDIETGIPCVSVTGECGDMVMFPKDVALAVATALQDIANAL
jgi:hypothetical protein